MYSTSSEGVTLQLRDTDDLDDKSGLASVLARLQQDDATLSISYQDTEMLTEGSIDVLLGSGSLHSTGKRDLFSRNSPEDYFFHRDRLFRGVSSLLPTRGEASPSRLRASLSTSDRKEQNRVKNG
ncbi:UNVERIFIED_CONTAM: hypothetical protein PYX00_006923 [Menopon gallinae]|uniref:Uncharacterized protein n=1 Tax=Menopon gallinae TaxID=328185 RepID=A0AAW2HH04_9NEOP